MKTNLLALLLSAFVFGGVTAQTVDNPCGTTQKYNELVEEYPEILETEKELERITRNFAEAKDTTPTYIIPIVFHIVHNYGIENISDEQILSAVEILNQDFNKLNPDTAGIIPEFQDNIADINIEFRLPSKDVYGNCTNGIDRIPSYLTYDGGNSAVKINQWPRESYLNVWVVNDMDGGTAGYALYPSAVNNQFSRGLDGIVVRHNYIGAIGTSSPGSSRTLSHEVGHWLNLAHVWGSTNEPGVACGDDGVADTPVSMGWSGCPTSPELAMICNDTIVENYQNFMEYSYCPAHMFTEDQKTRMRAALTSIIGNRNMLITDENLAMTGISEGNIAECSPTSDFYADRLYACIGDEVTFNPNTSRAIAETYLWEFSNASIETSEEANPTVSFNSTGWQEVTLTVGNEAGSTTRTKTQLIYISDPNQDSHAGEYFNGFASEEEFSEWIPVNHSESNPTHWEWSGAGYEFGSVKLTAFDSAGYDVDELISPSLDLTGMDDQTFSFKYAFATQQPAGEMDAELRVYSSFNCGGSWQQRIALTGGELLTAGLYDGIQFTPGDAANSTDWKTAQFNVTGLQASDNMRYKFQFTSDAGSNNLFIDQVRIGNIISGIEDLKNIYKVNVYPNPANGSTRLEYSLKSAEQVVIKLADITGREIQTVYSGNKTAGQQVQVVNLEDLSKGLYFINLQIGSETMTQKIMVN